MAMLPSFVAEVGAFMLFVMVTGALSVSALVFGASLGGEQKISTSVNEEKFRRTFAYLAEFCLCRADRPTPRPTPSATATMRITIMTMTPIALTQP